MLVYSKSQSESLCLCCGLFANSRSKATAGHGVLVNAPLIKFYKAKELLQKHSTKINFHKGAMADMHNFIAIMEQRRPSVIHLANSAHSSAVEKKSPCT